MAMSLKASVGPWNSSRTQRLRRAGAAGDRRMRERPIGGLADRREFRVRYLTADERPDDFTCNFRIWTASEARNRDRFESRPRTA